VEGGLRGPSPAMSEENSGPSLMVQLSGRENSARPRRQAASFVIPFLREVRRRHLVGQ
jgi:hypothetical protein